jgi:hypothetical protein
MVVEVSIVIATRIQRYIQISMIRKTNPYDSAYAETSRITQRMQSTSA